MTAEDRAVRPSGGGPRRDGTESLTAIAISWPGRVVICLVLVVWSIPMLASVLTSLRPSDRGQTSGWWNLVSDGQLTVDNYRQVLGDGELYGGFLASLAIALPSTVVPLVLGAAAAYVFSWCRTPLRDRLFLGVVALALLPVHMTLVPLVSVYTGGVEISGVTVIPAIPLGGTWPGLWLAHTAFALPIVVLLLRAAMAAVPGELVDAARADGAGHVDVFARIVTPLIVPALTAVAALQFLWVWNDFLVAGVLLGGFEPGTSPLTVGLAELVRTRGQDLGALSAGAVVTASVPVAIYLSLRQLVGSATRAAAFDQ